MSRHLLFATLLLAACQGGRQSSTATGPGEPIVPTSTTSSPPTASLPEGGARLHGKASGLEGKGLRLRLGEEVIAIDADSDFAFATILPMLTHYRVAIVGEPEGQHCGLVHGSGVINRQRPETVVVTCHSAEARYRIGGEVSGLRGTLTVTNASTGESLPLTANGVFAFHDQQCSGSLYDVRIVSQPAGQHCVVERSADRVYDSAVQSVHVSCVDAQCVNLGWKTGSGSFTCPTGYRMPTADDDALVAPCIDPADRGRFGTHADIASSVGGCGCDWNADFCDQPSIQTMHAGIACGDYAQLHVCVAQ